MPNTSRFSSDKDVNSNNRRFLSLTPSKRSRGGNIIRFRKPSLFIDYITNFIYNTVSESSNRSVIYASSPSLSRISNLDDQLTGSPLRVRKDPNSGRKVVPSQAPNTHSTLIKTRSIQKVTTQTKKNSLPVSKDSTPVSTETTLAQADASSSKKDETFTLTVTTNTGLNLHYNVCASLVPVFIYLFFRWKLQQLSRNDDQVLQHRCEASQGHGGSEADKRARHQRSSRPLSQGCR